MQNLTILALFHDTRTLIAFIAWTSFPVISRRWIVTRPDSCSGANITCLAARLPIRPATPLSINRCYGISSVVWVLCVLWDFAYTFDNLWADTLASRQLYLRPPWQNPVWILAHTNSVFTHSSKRPALVADTFQFCFPMLLTRASTLIQWSNMQTISIYDQLWLLYINMDYFLLFIPRVIQWVIR